MRLSFLVFLNLYLAVSLFYSAYFDTPTYDEPANMAASFDYIYRGDFRIYPDNPPLVKYLSGLAMYPISRQINFPSNLDIYQNPAKFDLYTFGREFLYNSSNSTRTIIFLTRLPNILFTLALGVLLYFFAKDLYGAESGLLALFLYTLDPNIRGHGHILAFDIPLAFFIMLILFLTHRWLTIRSKLKFKFINYQLPITNYQLLISVLFALGFLTKFTFIFFAVIYFVSLLILILRRKKQMVRSTLLLMIFTLVASFLLLWLFGIFTNYNKKTLDYDLVPIISTANKSLSHDLKWNLFKVIPVPYYYKIGMMTMYTHDLLSQPAFLLGQVHAKNDWFFYFPISFMLKTPIPTLILIALTILLLIIRSLKTPRGWQSRAKSRDMTPPMVKEQDISYFPFLIGFAFMLLMMLFSHINNVYRYLIPSLTLFILGTSQIVKLLDFKKPFSKLFLLSVICYMLYVSFSSFPFDLSYTNEFTGIPPQGYKYLSDSEVDWGQDLERLANWLKTSHYDKETITLSYLGTAEPAFYGIKYRQLKYEDLSRLSGIVAVSVGNLTLGDWQWRSQPEYKLGLLSAPLDFLRMKKPIKVIGKSIFIYRFL